MAYNKTVSKTIGFKTRYLELVIFPRSQRPKVGWREVVDEACDYCYYLSLGTLSYQSPISCHARYVGLKLLKPVCKIVYFPVNAGFQYAAVISDKREF